MPRVNNAQWRYKLGKLQLSVDKLFAARGGVEIIGKHYRDKGVGATIRYRPGEFSAWVRVELTWRGR